jgi:hypothetical protein
MSSYFGKDLLGTYCQVPLSVLVRDAASSLLHSVSDDYWAFNTRLRYVMDFVNQTEGGRNLSDNAAATGTSISFDHDLRFGGATISGCPSVIGLCPNDSVEVAANHCVHELGHELQDRRIELSLGSRNALEKNAQTIGDLIYPKIIMEGVSIALQVIDAYEHFKQGTTEPWLKLCFSSNTRPFAFALLERIEDGVDLQSDTMRRAIFDEGVKQGDFRWGYEADYLKYLVAHFRGAKLSQRGITHRNEDLWCIAENTCGISYLQGVDLKNKEYVGSLGDLFDFQETQKAARTASARENFVKSFGHARQIVDVIEYHLGYSTALAGLPNVYRSEQILDNAQFLITFGQAIKRAAKIFYTYGDISDGAARIEWLLYKAQKLADSNDISDWFSASVEAGQRTARQLRNSKLSRGAMPERSHFGFG